MNHKSFLLSGLFLLLLLTANSSPGSEILLAGWHCEKGVESKLLATLSSDFCAGNVFFIRTGATFSAIQHPGLSRLGLTLSPRIRSYWEFRPQLGFQHEQWNDWQTGENRAYLLLTAQPFSRLDLKLGLAYRAPIYSPAHSWLPWYYPREAAELNLLYGLRYRLLNTLRLTLETALENVTLLEMSNPQQLPLELACLWRLSPHWRLVGRCAAGFTGLSAMLISLNRLTAEIGVKHDL